MKVAITGSNGFVGTKLKNDFPDFIAIDRKDSVDEIVKKLEGVDVVINLAGATILKRWTPEYKKILYSSRIDTTKKLVQAINQSDIKHFISTSAIGIYGDDFLTTVTQDWEAQASKSNKPTTIMRFGIILGEGGGALSNMLTPFKLGLGGNIGDGKMIMSWIDIDDLVGIYRFVIDNKVCGTLDATAPNPVTNKEFTKALGRVLNRPTILPLPEFVLKIIFGEASSTLLSSIDVKPKTILDAGYKFKYEDIYSSLEHILIK
ncbi:MAG: TIGR01777 family oxidoreductase [Thiovulaceae bacterium]|nr:TIGR01777 family oxidoreductase [Sulfurimonadaceae bacterium]